MCLLKLLAELPGRTRPARAVAVVLQLQCIVLTSVHQHYNLKQLNEIWTRTFSYSHDVPPEQRISNVQRVLHALG